MDLPLIKTIAEAVGVSLTMLSIVLMGRPGRVQQWGVIVCLVAILPWTVFAWATASWFLVAQGVFSGVVNTFNLINLRRIAREAA